MRAYVANPKFDNEAFQVLQRYGQLMLKVTILEEANHRTLTTQQQP